MLSARRTWIAVALLSLAAAVSIALLLKHYGIRTPADAICGGEQVSGCDVVTQSVYAKLAGVPLAAIGLVFYVSLAAALALASFAGDAVRAAIARLAFLALGLALAVDLVLLGLQAGKLHAYCALCLTTYALGAGALVALLPARRAELGAALRTPEGRLSLAGALITTVATAAAAATYQVALEKRPASPAAIFGVGAAAPAVAAPAAGPVATPAPGDSLQHARQEAQRLQAILDDPQKLERYYSDKAIKEFEQAKIEKFDLAGTPFKGSADAPIKIVEFSDFLCPFCKQLADGLGAFLPQLGNRAALFYKEYPMDNSCNDSLKQQIHPGACVVAMGGVCAAEQNRFWQYHDRVFAKQGQVATRPDVLKAAGEAGLDVGALGACMDRPASWERLKAQIREGSAAGVKGTPTVFLNGKRVTRMNDFVAMIEKESARLGLPPLPSPQPPAR